jgi:hypothetical protein
MVWKTRSTTSVLVAAAVLCALAPGVAQGGPASGANSTVFGPNVFVFDPKMPADDVQNSTARIPVSLY